MANPAWSKRATAIERAENKQAHAIGIIRHVEALAELAESDAERGALLQILRGAAALKRLALSERQKA